MEHTDIHDPKGEFIFKVEWSTIRGSYDADEIQRMINDNGVMDAVKEINSFFSSREMSKPLLINRIDGTPAVINR